jgi:hypothetical protein
VKHLLASSCAPVLVLTLAFASPSLGQQSRGDASQQNGVDGNQGPGSQGKPGQSAGSQQGKQGTQGQSASQQSQAGGRQPQHRSVQGQQGSVSPNPVSYARWHYGPPISATGVQAFNWIDEASQNSGMTLAPADAALRAHLGLTPDEGLIVTAVQPGSLAASAGIQQNDVLTRLGDDHQRSTPLAKPGDLERGLKDVGDQPVSLVFFRAGHKLTIKVQPRVRVSLGPVRPDPPTYWIGLSVAPVEPALRAQLRIPDRQGLIILDVDKQGPAAKVGVLQNDILLSYDGVPLSDQAHLTKVVQDRGEKAIKLELVRQGKPLVLEITPGRRQSLSVALRHPELTTGQLEVVLPGGLFANQDGQWDLYLANSFIDVDQPPVTLDVLLSKDRWKVENRGGMTVGSDEATARRLDELSHHLEKQMALIKELQQVIEAMARAQEKK